MIRVDYRSIAISSWISFRLVIPGEATLAYTFRNDNWQFRTYKGEKLIQVIPQEIQQY